MSSNIVPFYSASPPPLDDHSIGNDDDDDDDFGDFSAAPSAVNLPSVARNIKNDDFNDNQFVFRPISPNEHRQEIDSFKSEANYFGENFTVAREIDDDSPKAEQSSLHWHTGSNGTEAGEKVHDDSSFKEFSTSRHTDLEKNAAVLDLKESSNNNLKPFKADLFLSDDLTSDACKETVEVESNHKDNLADSSFQRSVHENGRNMSEIKFGDQNVDTKSFADFESANSSVHDFQINSSNSEFHESDEFVSDNCISKKCNDEINVELTVKDEFKDFQSSGTSDDKSSSLLNIAKEGEFEVQKTELADDLNKSQTNQHSFPKHDVEEDDFDGFQIASEDVMVSTSITSADDHLEALDRLEEDIDRELDCVALDHGADSLEKLEDGQDDSDDFEEFKSSTDVKLENLTENEENEVVQTEVMNTIDDKSESKKLDTSTDRTGFGDRDDFGDFDEFQFPSEETPGDNSVVEISEKEEIKEIQNPESVSEDSPATNLQSVKNADTAEFEEFDEFEDFQAPPLDTGSHDNHVQTIDSEVDGDKSSWSAFDNDLSSEKTDDGSWANFTVASSGANLAKNTNVEQQNQSSLGKAVRYETGNLPIKQSQMKIDALMLRVLDNCYPSGAERVSAKFELLSDSVIREQTVQQNKNEGLSRSASFNAPGTDAVTNDGKSNSSDVCVWNNLKNMDLTAAFGFQWHTSSVGRNLLKAISIDTSSILVGHKKPQNPLFAPDLGLLEPMKASAELQNVSAEKEPLSFLSSDFPASSTATTTNSFTPQDAPPFEFDWGGSGLTNPLDATEKERELLDALEPASNESSAKMSPMSLETMLATFLPSIPSTQLIPKAQNGEKRQLSDEAIRVLAKLPDLSFMQAKVLMFPLKDTITN